MIKGYKSQLMDMYEKIRQKEKSNLANRQKELKEKLPQVFEYEREINKLSLKLSMLALRKHEKESFEKLKKEIENLRDEKDQLLAMSGYPKDYLEPIYDCPSCKDTGYIGQEKCHCLKKEIIKLLYSQSGITRQLEEENFSTFRYDYYSSNLIGDKPLSPRENISLIIELCKDFIEHFPEKHDNFLFKGNAGVGKTFLSNCIAKAILDKQCSVIYLTSFQLFDILEKHRFQKKYEEDNASTNIEFHYLFECDLLIIDDLGTEMNNSFVSSQLFLCINERLLKKKSTIISTNLSLAQLKEAYTERVTSRFIEHYHICNIYGEDIRLLKDLHN